METAPRTTDPDQVAYSLANLAEILIACLNAIAARSVVEVGAYRGDLTRVLLDWAASAGARITAIEPAPPTELLQLSERRPELELVGETSHAALRHIPLPDALILDGDHNYYTLSEELRLIHGRAHGANSPLLMFHDVGWPHARRDTYCAPQRIPEEHRQPLARNAGVEPGEPGVTENGLPFEWAATREGGPRNGVLTAIEDFVVGREGLRLAVVPGFFGLGVLWHEDAPWAMAVADILEPWDRNPVLQRLETNRVHHLVSAHVGGRLLEEERQRNAQQEQVLRTMLGSRAFAWAERLSWLRQRGRPRISREQVRRALGE